MSNIPLPWSYVYRYPDGALRMGGGCEVNGSKPVEAIGVYLAPVIEAERAEKDALHAGLSAIIHCQSALRRSEMREAAAGLLDKVGLKPMWFDGDQSPFVRRALAAEARVRELEDRVGVLERDLDAQSAGHRLSANEATKHLMRVRELEEELADQRTIAKYNREQAEAVERRLAEAYERCAKVADKVEFDAESELSGLFYTERYGMSCRSDAATEIAAAIRQLAQVKHEDE